MYKRVILAVFLLLLALSVVFCFSCVSESIENCPFVYIVPENASGKHVGEIFTVIVGVNYLMDKDLYGFDIMLRWDPLSLEYISHEAKVPAEVYSDGVLHEPVLEVKNEVDMIEGTCWIAYASISPADPFNENGVFFTITFKVIKESNSTITFEHLFLANYQGEVIPLSKQNAWSSDKTGDSIINEHRRLKAQKWLEWWIKVTWQMAKRRPTATGR